MSVGPRGCTITIAIDEAEDGMRAVARMDWQGRKLAGVGGTRLGEMFPDRASERLAVSRALSDLVARLNAWPGDDALTATPRYLSQD